MILAVDILLCVLLFPTIAAFFPSIYLLAMVGAFIAIDSILSTVVNFTLNQILLPHFLCPNFIHMVGQIQNWCGKTNDSTQTQMEQIFEDKVLTPQCELKPKNQSIVEKVKEKWACFFTTSSQSSVEETLHTGLSF